MRAQRGVYEARDGSVRNDMGNMGGCVGQDWAQARFFARRTTHLITITLPDSVPSFSALGSGQPLNLMISLPEFEL